jgi:hypothetical protein
LSADEPIKSEATLRAPTLQRLYQDWRARRRARFPLRRDFDPLDFRYILGGMSLVENSRDPLRFLVRVHGTNLAEQIGMEFSGKFIDEAPQTEFFRLARQHYQDAVDSECPSMANHVSTVEDETVWDAEALMLPLSLGGETLDFLLAAIVHHRRPCRFEID